MTLSDYVHVTTDKLMPDNTVYHLKAVILHLGAFNNSGHYIAHTLSSDDHWRCYDDTSVSVVEDRSIQGLEWNTNSYIYFYVASDDPK